MLALELARDPEALRDRFHSLETVPDVADLLEVSHAQFVHIAYRSGSRHNYREFQIPKRSGGTRTISAPPDSLSILQHKLKTVFELVYRPRRATHGFVKGRSILSNAQAHASKRFVLNLDLKDFFPSISFRRVRGMLMAKPYSLPARPATVLAQLCCYKDALPQGAPTSPIVANMICSKLDAELQRLAHAHRCTYTRYADDLTLSTTRPSFPSQLAAWSGGWGPSAVHLGQPLVEVIKENGFEINPLKVRVQYRACHQEVTGLTVNRRPNVGRRFIRQLRAMIHAWGIYGPDAAEEEYYGKYHPQQGHSKPPFVRIVRGKLDFLKMVRGEDDAVYRNLCSQLHAIDPDIIPEPPILRSCFISYGEPDLDFARRIYDDLGKSGVSCWMYNLDGTAGARVWKEITERRRAADKILAICSIRGLLQDGIRQELEDQVNEDPSKIIVLSLDKSWSHPGNTVRRGEGQDLKQPLLDRNYADFVNLDYDAALTRLLRGLRSEEILEQTLPTVRSQLEA